MISAKEHTALLLELAEELENTASMMARVPMRKHEALATRARAAAAELGEQSERAMILSRRLKELSTAAADGRMAEFLMRIPAEPDRDADLVLDESSDMLARFGGGEVPSP